MAQLSSPPGQSGSGASDLQKNDRGFALENDPTLEKETIPEGDSDKRVNGNPNRRRTLFWFAIGLLALIAVVIGVGVGFGVGLRNRNANRSR